MHGDLRLGNVIVDEHGLAAAIDWELVQLGDPLQDLAYLCLKAWRFGGPGEAAGLGTVDELLTTYEAAGGRPVDRDAFHWWLVERTLHWGIGCMAQGDAHLSGRVRSMELAAVGRRAAEQEWDLVELLAPDAARARARRADAGSPPRRPDALRPPDGARSCSTRWPTSSPTTSPRATIPGLAYQGRVAANVVRMVERELAHPATRRAGDDWDTLALDVRDRLAVANPKHLGRSDQSDRELKSSAQFFQRILSLSSSPNDVEPLVGERLRVRPRGLGVRVVARPHDPVDADVVPLAQAHRVLHERRPHLTLEVEARRLGELALGPVPVLLPEVVRVVLEERDPADLALDRDEPEVGVPLHHESVDELADRLRHRELAHHQARS